MAALAMDSSVFLEWYNAKPDIVPGTLVFLKDDLSPSFHWRLGRVSDTYQGSDGVGRVVTVKTPQGTYRGPVVKNLAALGPLVLTAGTGMVIGYSATLLPQLQNKEDGVVTVNQDEASWIASVAVLPMALGSLLASYLLERFGRKSAHILICLPKTVGWLLITFATSIKFIILGRILTGFCTGVLNVITSVYIGEICSPHHRGLMLAALTCSFSFGLALVHVLGTFFSWQTTALISSILPLVSLVSLCFAYESPPYLSKIGKTTEAEKSYIWFHGKTETSKQEIKELLERQREATEKPLEGNKNTKSFKKFFTPQFFKPLTIVTVLFVVCQFSGPNVINFYSVAIIKKTVGNTVNEYLTMIVVDVIRVLASIVACILTRKFNRRPLAICSGVGTFSSLFVLSLYGYLLRMYPELVGQYYVVPVIALVAYICFIFLGFVPLPWALQGELLPLWGRGLGCGICTFFQCVAAFVTVKTSLRLIESIGTEGIFLLFGLAALLGTFFVYFCLPETKGRTLDEIEEYFKGTDEENKRSGLI